MHNFLTFIGCTIQKGSFTLYLFLYFFRTGLCTEVLPKYQNILKLRNIYLRSKITLDIYIYFFDETRIYKSANGVRKINIIQLKDKFVFLISVVNVYFLVLSMNSLNFNLFIFFRKQDVIACIILLLK